MSDQDLYLPASALLRSLQVWAGGHGWYSWREPAAPFPAAGSCGSAAHSPPGVDKVLPPGVWLQAFIFLQAQLFVRPAFELLGRGDGTHQLDQGGRLGPRTCMGMMPYPVPTTYSEDMCEGLELELGALLTRAAGLRQGMAESLLEIRIGPAERVGCSRREAEEASPGPSWRGSHGGERLQAGWAAPAGARHMLGCEMGWST